MNIKSNKPSKKSKYKQNYYYPINPIKYVGPYPIICRSSWETKFCMYCDNNESIIQWTSESIQIRYYNPKDEKYHTYFPDFLIKVQKSSGVKYFLVEVKPFKETLRPVMPKRKTVKSVKSYKYKVDTYIKNFYKSKAATKYAKERGWEFIFITEKFLKS
jgi:hypothetical protein